MSGFSFQLREGNSVTCHQLRIKRDACICILLSSSLLNFLAYLVNCESFFAGNLCLNKVYCYYFSLLLEKHQNVYVIIIHMISISEIDPIAAFENETQDRCFIRLILLCRIKNY